MQYNKEKEPRTLEISKIDNGLLEIFEIRQALALRIIILKKYTLNKETLAYDDLGSRVKKLNYEYKP